MASTGNIFPTVGASVDRASSTAWTSPGNVTADDAANASAVVPTDYLVCSAFGFAIPSNAIILGVTVRVEASETGTGASNYVPQLHSDTTPTLIGAAKSAVTVTGATPVISTNGGAADLWGANLSPEIVNSAGFGVSLWSTDTTNTLAIDFVTIAVEYVVPEPRSSTPASLGPFLPPQRGAGSQFVTLDAVIDVAAAGSLSITGAGALTGTGDLAAAGSLSVAGAAALNASGTLAAAGSLSVTGAAVLDATGALAAAGSLSIFGAANLTEADSPNVAAAGSLSITGATSISATGALAGAGSVSITGAATLNGAGNLAGAGSLSISGAGTMSAPGSLAAAGTAVISGAAALGDGGVEAPRYGSLPNRYGPFLQPVKQTLSREFLTTDFTIDAVGSLSITGAASLNAVGQVAAAGALSISGAAEISTQASMSAAGALSIVGQALLNALGTLVAAGSLAISGAASLLGPPVLVGRPSKQLGPYFLLFRRSTGATKMADLLRAVGLVAVTGAAGLTATGALAATGSLSISGSASIVGTASDVGASGSLSVTGNATVSGAGALVAAGSASVTGAATVSARGEVTASGSVVIAGAGADLVPSLVTVSASGSLSITGVAELNAPGDLAATGSLTISGVAFVLVPPGTLSLSRASRRDFSARLSGPRAFTRRPERG